MSRPRLLVLLLAALFLSTSAVAQRAPGSVKTWEHETSDIQVNDRITFGHLDNGLRYVWMANPEPDQRSYVRLHVDVGSLGETPEEAGMAHFLEHMAFNGSDNFEPGTLVEWFQANGMSFGADTNASTGFSETIYMLNLPYSDAETLNEGLQVLRDFAAGLLLTEEEVQAEKGVIDGEQRERDSAFYRAFVESLERQYAGTAYPDKLPIGYKETRDEFTAESVRAFYERWYRPENMTLVIVGDLEDFDPTELVHQYFTDLPVPEGEVLPEPPRGDPSLDDLFFVINEPEISQVSITVEMLRPWEDEPVNTETVTEDVPLWLAHRMLNLRYSELAKEEGAPFLSASVGQAGGLKIFEGETLRVSCDPDKWEEALLAADTELRRSLEFGFQQAQLNEVRADWLRSLDESVDREATRNSGSFVREILSAVENRDVPTTAETDRRILRPAIEAVTLEACHTALVKGWGEGTLSISAMGNLDLGEDAGAALKAAFDRGRAAEIERGETIEVATFAYASDAAAAVEPVSKTHVEDLDVWLVEFANGVRMNLKATDFKEKEIVIAARLAEGGLTLSNDEYSTGFAANAAFNGGGLEAHSEDELRRLTAGKQVGVGFGMGDDAFQIAGGTTTEDLLMQFELMCAYLQHPGWREEGMRQLHQQMPLQYQQLAMLPQGPMLMEFMPALFSDNPRFVPLPELEEVMAVEMDQIRSWLTPHLDDGPLEITVVGDFDVDAVVAAAGRTFGVLSPRRERVDHTDRTRVTPPKTGLRMDRTIQTQVPKSLVHIVFPTNDGLEPERRRALSFMGQVVNDRLRVEVREKLGASYSPGARSSANRVFPGVGQVDIQAMADPDKVDTLLEACLDVARDLAENGVTQEELDRLREPILASLRDSQRTNGWWRSVLGQVQSKPERLEDARTVEAFYRELSPEVITELTGRYLDPERASVLVVNPDSGAGSH